LKGRDRVLLSRMLRDILSPWVLLLFHKHDCSSAWHG
jgi:hypothetical protein